MKSIRSFAVFCFVVLAAALAAAPSVEAAEATVKESKGWEFDIVPYVWGAGIGGSVGIGQLPAQGVQASFSDIWNNLDIAGMAAFEAHKGNWGVLVDAVYVDLSKSMPTPDEVVYGSADVSMNQQLYSGLITYRIHDGDKVTVDMGWGTRYYRLDSSLELTGGVAAGRKVSGTEDWWDWLAGVRVVGHPSKRWSLMGYADLGGGGSDLTWEGIVSADFAFNKTVSLAFGYRYLDVYYEKNSFLYDVSMQGPFLGLGFHW